MSSSSSLSRAKRGISGGAATNEGFSAAPPMIPRSARDKLKKLLVRNQLDHMLPAFRGRRGGGADVELAREDQIGIDFPIRREADHEVSVRLLAVVVRVAPGIAEHRRGDVERRQ